MLTELVEKVPPINVEISAVNLSVRYPTPDLAECTYNYPGMLLGDVAPLCACVTSIVCESWCVRLSQ